MNNRFLPWDVIETDAIFLVDDDIIVTQEEIVYGFRYIKYQYIHIYFWQKQPLHRAYRPSVHVLDESWDMLEQNFMNLAYRTSCSPIEWGY